MARTALYWLMLLAAVAMVLDSRTVDASSVSSFSPVTIRGGFNPSDTLTITGTGLSSADVLKLVPQTTQSTPACSAAGTSFSTNTLNGASGTSTTSAWSFTTASLSGVYVVCYAYAATSSSFEQVGSITLRIPTVTGFTPTSTGATDPLAVVIITGVALRVTDVVQFSSGACTTSSVVATATGILYTNDNETQLGVYVGGTGLPSTATNVCITYDNITPIVTVTGAIAVVDLTGAGVTPGTQYSFAPTRIPHIDIAAVITLTGYGFETSHVVQFVENTGGATCATGPYITATGPRFVSPSGPTANWSPTLPGQVVPPMPSEDPVGLANLPSISPNTRMTVTVGGTGLTASSNHYYVCWAPSSSVTPRAVGSTLLTVVGFTHFTPTAVAPNNMAFTLTLTGTNLSTRDRVAIVAGHECPHAIPFSSAPAYVVSGPTQLDGSNQIGVVAAVASNAGFYQVCVYVNSLSTADDSGIINNWRHAGDNPIPVSVLTVGATITPLTIPESDSTVTFQMAYSSLPTAFSLVAYGAACGAHAAGGTVTISSTGLVTFSTGQTAGVYKVCVTIGSAYPISTSYGAGVTDLAVVVGKCGWYNVNFRPMQYTHTLPMLTWGAQSAGACAGDTTLSSGCKWCAASQRALGDITAVGFATRGMCVNSATTCPSGFNGESHTLALDMTTDYQHADYTMPEYNLWLENTHQQLEQVFPNRFAYYKITPPHRNFNVRVMVRTRDYLRLGDNLDVYARRGGSLNLRPDTTVWDFTSVRESNPWAIDINAEDLPSALICGGNTQPCYPYFIGVMGDNQFPQKSGASQYELQVWLEFNYTDFTCADAAGVCTNLRAQNGAGASRHLQISSYSAAAGQYSQTVLFLTDDLSNKVMRLVANPTVAVNSAALGTVVSRHRRSFVYVQDPVHMINGFETRFKFRIHHLGLCSELDGFCGGADGFAMVISKVLPSTFPALSVPSQSFTPPDVGRGLGYEGMPDTLAIEFDTWFTKNYYDPKQGVEHWWINATEYVAYSDNHVAVFSSTSNGGAVSADHSSNSLIGATPSIPNLSDGQIHEVRVWYLPPMFGHPGSLSIFIDNFSRPVLVVDVTLSRTTVYDSTPTFSNFLKNRGVLTDTGFGYIGFTGAFGDVSQTVDILSWGYCHKLGCVSY